MGNENCLKVANSLAQRMKLVKSNMFKQECIESMFHRLERGSPIPREIRISSNDNKSGLFQNDVRNYTQF